MEGICSVCEEDKRVHYNRKTGEPNCSGCYQMARYRDPSTHKKCFECGEVKPMAMRNESGDAICHNCYCKNQSRQEKCFECGKVRLVATRTDSGEPICSVCHKRSKIGKCVECEEIKIIQALGLCYGCYQRQRRKNMAASPA